MRRLRLLELLEEEEVGERLDLLFFSRLDREVLAFLREELRPRSWEVESRAFSGSPRLEGWPAFEGGPSVQMPGGGIFRMIEVSTGAFTIGAKGQGASPAALAEAGAPARSPGASP